MADEETKERVSRPRLTVTSMIDAIEDIYISTLPENDQDQVEVSIDLRRGHSVGGTPPYIAKLFKYMDDEAEVAASAESLEGFEQAVASLLEAVKEKLEARKKEILASLSSVSDRHRATIRGARKKTKSKE